MLAPSTAKSGKPDVPRLTLMAFEKLPRARRTLRCNGASGRGMLPWMTQQPSDREGLLAEIASLTRRLGELNDRLDALDRIDGVEEDWGEEVTTVFDTRPPPPSSAEPP